MCQDYCPVSLPVLCLFSGEVIVPVSFQFVINANFSADLLNRSSSRFVALEENIRQTVRKALFMLLIRLVVELNVHYYMASCLSEQDKLNPAQWLPEQDRFPLGITHFIPQEKKSFSPFLPLMA